MFQKDSSLSILFCSKLQVLRYTYQSRKQVERRGSRQNNTVRTRHWVKFHILDTFVIILIDSLCFHKKYSTITNSWISHDTSHSQSLFLVSPNRQLPCLTVEMTPNCGGSRFGRPKISVPTFCGHLFLTYDTDRGVCPFWSPSLDLLQANDGLNIIQV